MPNDWVQAVNESVTGLMKRVGAPHGTVDLTSPIGIKWANSGGPSTIGNPLSNAIQLNDGIGQLQIFESGAIFWSPAFGAVFVSEPIFRKWASPSVELGATASGESIQSFLGYPTDDTLHSDSVAGLRQWSYFERGMIYSGPEGTWVVYDRIYALYRTLDGHAGFLGAPLSDEMAALGNGRVSHFVGGDIYWHTRTGAHEVHGAIRARWLDLGGPASPLGYPSSNEERIFSKSAAQPGGAIGAFNRFENGSGIYWSPATGAWEVHGAIWAEWEKTGGPAGPFGFPTGGELNTPNTGGQYNEFEHGIIVWHGGGPFVGAIGVMNLAFDVSEYNVSEDFNVQIHITATPNNVNHGRMPAGGEYDGGVQVFSPPQRLIAVDLVRADTTITVWLNAIHELIIGEDDRMGTITANYSIDNLWGLREKDWKHHDRAFDAIFRVRPKTDAETNDPDKLFWPFNNHCTFKLSWDVYARTFRDVKETDKHVSFDPFNWSIHPWEIFFYETWYNSLAQLGACFGMCLEAIYAREGRTLFMEPLKDGDFNPYDPDTAVLDPALPGHQLTLDEIDVKHGYQLGGGLLEWILMKWVEGAVHDPVRAYWESYFQFQSGNWPILTVSNDNMTRTGHAVVPFEWSHTDPKHPDLSRPWTILVKNPKYSQAPHTDEHCKIEIDPRTEKFTYLHKKDDLWTGSKVMGGRLMSIPFTELNARPLMPGQEPFALLVKSVIVIADGDTETEQITDGFGNTLFHPRSIDPHHLRHASSLTAREINWDPATRIPNLMKVPILSSDEDALSTDASAEPQALTATAPELYYWQPETSRALPTGDIVNLPTEETSPGATKLKSWSVVGSPSVLMNRAKASALNCQIRGTREGTFRWTVIAPCMSASVVASTEPGVVDSIHLGDAGGHFQHVVVAFPNATKVRNVAIALAGWRGHDRQKARSFVLEKLSMGASHWIRAQVTDGGNELLVENTGPAMDFDLKLLVGLPSESIGSRPGLRLDAKSVTRIRPADWSLGTPVLTPIRLEVLDRIGGNILTVKTI